MHSFTQKIKILAGCGLLMLSSLIPVTAAADKAPPPAKVTVDQVRNQDVADQLWWPGTVISRYDARIATEVSGRIRWMAEIGDRFNSGDVLVKLDDQLLQLALLDNQSVVIQLSAKVSLYQRQLKRFSQTNGSTSQDQLDEKSSALIMAQQELAQAKIAERRSRYLLQQTELKATFDGTVVERLQQIGEFSRVGGAVMRIVDLERLEVLVKAPLTAAAYINSGMMVEVKDRHQLVTNPVRTVSPVGDQRSRMMELRLTLNTGNWRVGSAVRVALPNSERHQGLTVHRDALILRQNQTYLYVVDQELHARRVDVVLGAGVKEFIEISGELVAGDRVVVRGGERLKDGQAVVLQQDNYFAKLINN